MKNTKYIFGLVMSFLILSGCSSTTPIASRNAVHIPSDRHLNFKKPHPDASVVIITRDKGLAGSLCATRVYANGKLAAYVKPGEKVQLHVRSSQIILGIQPDGICGGAFVEREVKTSPSKPSYYRISYDHGGTMGLYPTAFR